MGDFSLVSSLKMGRFSQTLYFSDSIGAFYNYHHHHHQDCRFDCEDLLTWLGASL